MKKFVQRGYKASYLKGKIDKAKSFDRAVLLNYSKVPKNGNYIPLVISYNRTAPNVSKIMQKHWPILQINNGIRK